MSDSSIVTKPRFQKNRLIDTKPRYKLLCKNNRNSTLRLFLSDKKVKRMAGKKWQVIWCMINIYCLEVNDRRLAQVEFIDTMFHELVLKNPSEISEH